MKPVAWHEPNSYGKVTTHKKWALENGWLPLYAAPVRVKDLTDDEVLDAFEKAACHETYRMLDGCRAVIAADRKLNGVEK